MFYMPRQYRKETMNDKNNNKIKKNESALKNI